MPSLHHHFVLFIYVPFCCYIYFYIVMEMNNASSQSWDPGSWSSHLNFLTTMRLTRSHLNAGSGGILKLHEDVQTCGYKDVQVMFDMLTSELEAAAQAQKPPPSPPPKRAPPPVWPGRPLSTIAAAQ